MSRIEIYKQEPGADIEPGWWAVVDPPWWDAGEKPRWLGPFQRKQEAQLEARHVLKQWEE